MRLCSVWARFIGIAYHSIVCNRPIPISIAAVPQAVSTPNLPRSKTTLLSLSTSPTYMVILHYQTNNPFRSTLESESVAAVAMLSNALAGRNRSASDVIRFRLSSVKLRNHKVGYFDPPLRAVRVMICVATFCIGDKCSVVLCLKNRKYGGVSSLNNFEQNYTMPLIKAFRRSISKHATLFIVFECQFPVYTFY